jgi:molybdopterin converting factor small subunit
VASVLVPGLWEEVVGPVRRLQVPAATVAELVERLKALHPGLRRWLDDGAGNLPEFMNVFVGEEDIRILQGLATPLRSSDQVVFIPVISGGSGSSGSLAESGSNARR